MQICEKNMKKVLIHHAEIGLKKGNFAYFEKKLVQNMKKAAQKNNLKLQTIQRHEKRIVAEFDASEKKISKALKNVFGVKYFAFVEETDKKLENMEKLAEKFLENEKISKVAFKTKRADKKFELTSIEMNKKFGDIASRLKIKVDYKNPDKTIFTEVTSKKVYMYNKRINGLGGLPVSTGGRVLCLLSGGIDSPLAAWLMMKRGCGVDFLHFHTYRDNKEVLKTKMKKLVEELDKYQFKSKLYLIPYLTYEITTQGKMFQKYDLALFKHYMLRVAEKFAVQNKYDGVVTGDSLAQVASQTIENIKATSQDVNALIFRPLLTYDKQEIINLAKKIGTYDISIEKYKDCCSILARKPATKTKPEILKRIAKDVEMETLVEKSMKEVGGFDISSQ